MAELTPVPFARLLTRIHREYTRCEAIFDLPKRKFHIPGGSVDMSVVSCGNPAANPLGPAAGPHTQLAQNIVLSWLAGARIIELKTVQVNDRLTLSRPCIDVATIGYNTEWSQELTLDESAREYVKAHMIIEILTHWLFRSGRLTDQRAMNLDTIFDVSVGYDLAGIRSMPIRRWLGAMQNASALIDALRAEIPDEFAAYRSLPFNTKISDSITLSTFHGTPADEIEHICEFLMEEMRFHVVVKMNPPMLGKQRLEHLLHDTLGYSEIEVNPKAYDVNIAFDDAASMVTRLQAVAARTRRTVGVKFGNTLEVVNKGTFLKDAVQYLSGQPLHVLHLALTAEWRNAFGPDFPVSFSAGVDALNFSDCVAIGLVPVTTCTDLLRPGGYGRLGQYLLNLEQRMTAVGAVTIDEFILRSRAGDGARGAANALNDTMHTDVAKIGAAELSAISSFMTEVYAAGAAGVEHVHDRRRSVVYGDAVMKNTAAVLRKAIDDPRYRMASNSRPPRKVGSHLSVWDCLNCDKCIPVCPNDANFSFEVEPASIAYRDVEIAADTWREVDGGVYSISKRNQIGTYADACNACGNCDVFCPEDGGPYVEKPRFFGSLETYRKQHEMDGFVLLSGTETVTLVGRVAGSEYELALDWERQQAAFTAARAVVTIAWNTHVVLDARLTDGTEAVRIDMRYYLLMAALLRGMLAPGRVNFVNSDINH